MNMKNFISNVLIIAGPSGSGKGTIIQEMGNELFEKSISYTTRPPRTNEVDGVDYYFITADEFRDMIHNDELYEWNEYGGRYYGTPKTEIARINKSGKVAVLDIDVNGAKNIKKIYPDAASVFILLKNVSEQRRRLEGRKENTEEEIEKRIETTKKELTCLDIFDKVFINEPFKQKETALNVIKYITGEDVCSCDYENLVKEYFNS